MITFVYNEILYRPLLNLLIWFYNIIPGQDIGIAIIILTILVRFLLYPFYTKSVKSQKALQKLQPEIQKIKEKYKNNSEQQSKEMMKFYKENKINPLSGCLPLLIQLPILIALFRVFQQGLDPKHLDTLYSFVSRPEIIHTHFLGVIDLAVPSLILALLAAISQFFQSKMLLVKQKQKKSDFASMMSQQMTYFMPFITFFIAMRLPAALALYWLITTLFAISQQYFIMKKRTFSSDKIK